METKEEKYERERNEFADFCEYVFNGDHEDEEEEQEKEEEEDLLPAQPCRFTTPMNISDELCEFLDKPCGTKVALTYITKEIIGYIRDNNLKDPNNTRQFIPDSKLQALFKLKTFEPISYFKLQTNMAPHTTKYKPEEVCSKPTMK